MINPNELRIGNLIFCRCHLEVVTVQWPHPAQVIVGYKNPCFQADHVHGNLNDFDPLPLTAEWLEGMGFEKSYSTYFQGIIYIYEGPGHWQGQTGWPIGIRDHVSMRIVRMIDYVHQLQNLYFALTGEELIIKEPA